MSSVADRYCARGEWCTQYRHLDAPAKIRSTAKSEICDHCHKKHVGALRTSNNNRWTREVLEALEAVLPRLRGLELFREASMWDLLELDISERGQCLSRLNASTLIKLADWLVVNEKEALEEKGYKPGRFIGLWRDARIFARLDSLPPGELLDAPDPLLPFAAAAYERSGRSKDLTVPFRIEFLRQDPTFRWSERNVAEELGIPYRTVRDILTRMKEVNFSIEGTPPEELAHKLAYIMRGENRGRKPQS